MTKPTPTTCMAMSLLMPNSEQHSGISSSEPPATPDAPHALTAASTHRMPAVMGLMAMPMVLAAAMDITVMVIAAPAMLMVAPSGMETEYVSCLMPRRLHSSMFTGMLAAELRVKKAYMPESLMQRNTMG